MPAKAHLDTIGVYEVPVISNKSSMNLIALLKTINPKKLKIINAAKQSHSMCAMRQTNLCILLLFYDLKMSHQSQYTIFNTTPVTCTLI